MNYFQNNHINVAKKVAEYFAVYNKIATFAASKDEKFFEFMKKSELEKRLKSLGCYLASHGKKHDKWVNRKTGTFEFVPRHADEVASGTASKILKRLAGE